LSLYKIDLLEFVLLYVLWPIKADVDVGYECGGGPVGVMVNDEIIVDDNSVLESRARASG